MADVDPQAILDAATAVIDDIVSSIDERRDELVEQFRATIASLDADRLCGMRESHLTSPCDRPRNHHGDCSWATEQIRRRYRGYEEEVVGLRRTVAEQAERIEALQVMASKRGPKRA